ncbi:MAG: glycoside hydrolase/phage tail family protein [Pseudomonadota bacterium]
MAEIVLTQVGQALGSYLLPQGVRVLGQQVSGAAIGRFAGQLAGRAIDASLATPIEGPRVESLRVMESREGAGLPLIYGRARVGGQVIWASRFKERRRDRTIGKGGPKVSEYRYSVSFAVAVGQGPVTRLDRVWANGEPLALADYNWRFYTGTEDQMPDPIIEAIEGVGAAPAFRGTAYIVFEDLPLEAFGNRLPQLSFEVVRAGDVRGGSLREAVRGVNIIPASGEFVYGTTQVRDWQFPGIERPLNMHNSEGRADFAVSLDQLRQDLPRAQAVALTVAWFGDRVEAGQCRIRPGVETRTRETEPYSWKVAGEGRATAHLISRDGNGGASYGGTPADRAVLEGIAALSQAGLAVTLSPFLLMDSAGFPWRGRISVDADGTAAARAEIDQFVGVDRGFGYRHFILHHARLAAQAMAEGHAVEAVLLGSEFVGLTRVRDDQGRFPFVEALVALAAEVKAIVGPSVKVSYAADWTEYGAYVPGDGSGDVLFPLDALWAAPDIDFVGVDWYAPLGDWRDGADHLDALAGYAAADDPAYLAANLQGGEGYDWYYASAADRLAQIRTPIVDTAHGEDWIFRQKDLLGWWGTAHYPRPGGTRALSPTAWQPGSKPLRLIEIGFPAVDRGGNAPNLFYDPKSDESAFPPFSSGARDDLYQRRALIAALSFWQAQPGVEQALVWAWDGRPWPDYPVRTDVWSDGPNWRFGHWLNGRTGLIDLSEVVEDLALRAGTGIGVDGLAGVVEGFVLAGLSNLRTALAPLEAGFGLGLRERGGQLVAFQTTVEAAMDLGALDPVADSLSVEESVMETRPGGLALTYISGAGDYAPALAEVRNPEGNRDVLSAVTLPLVMGEGRARDVASRLLQRALDARSMQVSLPVGEMSVAVESGDWVRLEDADWQVSDLRERGLARTLRLQPPAPVAPSRRIEPGERDPAPVRPARPVFSIIDAPSLPGRSGARPVVAATANPWSGAVQIRAGADTTSLSVRGQVEQPCGYGRLEQALVKGPLGRWDEASAIEVYMPGEDLASRSSLAVLNGAEGLLIEGAPDEGFEWLSYRYAELVGVNRWRLTGLLRGLGGSPILAAPAGRLVILADSRLAEAVIDPAEIGLPLVWQVGDGVVETVTYGDESGRPWRVGHLRAEPEGAHLRVTWTRRGRDLPESWSLPEASAEGLFQVRIEDGNGAVEEQQVIVPEMTVPGNTRRIDIAAIAVDGRTGPWVSISPAGA